MLPLMLASLVVLADDGLLLRESTPVGQQVNAKLHLVIHGSLRLGAQQEKMAGQAVLEYAERVLDVGKDGVPIRVARHYDDARAKFAIGKGEDPRQVRVDRRLLVGERSGHLLELWSPLGPLTSDERELVEDVLDTTRITSLLPPTPVSNGGRWTVEPSVLLALCRLEHFVSAEVKGTLTKVADGRATVRIEGPIHGLVLGAEVKSKLDVTLTMRVDPPFIEEVTWNQQDSRGPSPVNPAGSFEVKMSLTRQAVDSPRLSDQAIAHIPAKSEGFKSIVFADAQRRYQFLHDRQWHVTMINNDRAVLRRVVDGEFVAQLNVTTIDASKEKRAQMTAEQLQAMVEESGGWHIDRVLKTDSLKLGEKKFDVQLLIAEGKSGGVALHQRHFIATTRSGKQVILSFLIEPHNQEKLGDGDFSLVSTVEFPDDTASTAEPAR